MLKFTSNQFEALLTDKPASTVTRNLLDPVIETRANRPDMQRPIKKASLTRQARIDDRNQQCASQHSNKALSSNHSSLETISSYDKTVSITDDMDISIELTPNKNSKTMDRCETSILVDCKPKPSESQSTDHQIKETNYSIRSDIDILLNSPILIESTANVDKARIKDSMPKTPVSKLRRSFSFNPVSSKKANKENIYEHLPCTPPKRKSLKRPLSTLDSSNANEASTSNEFKVPAAKRKLYDDYSRKYDYSGYEKMDIMAHLAQHNSSTIINTILSQLSDDDLQAAYRVSESWANLIDDNTSANCRRRRMLRVLRSTKENRDLNRIESLGEQLDDVSRELGNRKPFTSINVVQTESKHQARIIRSPPVSPSKRKFYENQKVRGYPEFANMHHTLFIINI